MIRSLSVFAALAATVAAQTYTPHTGSPYAVGGGIQALTAVDLNGDGKLDLVVTNSTNNGNPTVTALTNTGSGFSAGTPVIVGANPVAVFGAFKSSNNLPGVFTANQNASTITRLNNDGSGNLSVGGTYSLSFQPRGGVVADFNGDGNTELAILGPGIVQTYSWSDASPMNSYTVGNQARAIASGDFNGDGKPDLVVVNFDSSINFLANTGSSFAAASTHPTGGANGLTDIAVADFNRDGKLDVVVAASANNGVTLFQGDGGGGFTLIGTIGAGSLPRAVRATDMDGDGFPDIVVLNSDDKVTLLLGNGSFSGGGVGSGFSTASGSPYTVGANPAGLVAADFNGDGRPDLAETNANHGNIHVLVNNAPSIKAKPTVLTFYASKRAGAAAPAAIPVAVSSSQSGSTYAAGTGQAYLTLSPASNATGGTSNVTVTASQAALNAGTATGRARFTASGFSSGRTDVTVNVAQTSGGLSAASYSPIAVSGVASIAAADMNHDGIPDLVAFGGSAYKVYNGTGTAFSLDRTQGISGGISAFGVTLGDLNGDGFPDIFWAGNNQLNYALTGWNAFANSTISTSPSNAVSAATGDFNADGYPDAVAVDGGGTLHILRNDGFGNLVRVGTLTGVSSPQGMATGDFNGDGYADFAVAQNNAASLLVYLGNGDYSFQSPATVATGANPMGIAAADVNGDGKIDLLAVNSVASGSLTVQLGNGSGGFSPASGSPFAIGSFPQRLTVADLDGDGFPDVASANNGSNTVAVLKNDGTGSFPTSTSYTVGSSPSWIASSDFNGDGRQDLAVLAGSSIYVLLGTAQQPVTVTWANPAPVTYPTALSGTQLNATFTNGGNPVAGTAVYTPAAGTVPAVGTQTLAVAFTPTSSGFAYTLANATLTVTKGTPGVSVSAVSNPSPYGNASFVVALTTTGGGAAPTGTVTLFYDTTHSLGTQTLAAGSATFSALTIPAGAHTITATYSGDSNFNGVTSSALAHTVSSEPLIPASGSPFAIAGANDYQSLASGDFNGDGNMDVAITLTGTSQIAVMAGNGLGGFTMAPGSPFASGGAFPNRIVTADFDGDGQLDLATSNETGTGATFSVLKGNGSGQFTPFSGSPFSSGGNVAHGITATDINNDGKMDLVVVNLGSNNAGVFLNNGTGSFSPASGSPLTFSAVGKVAAGDFNGDGFTDLAMTGGSSISIRLGTGTGTFTTGSTVTGGPAMSEIAAADFNLDGKLDLVAANQQTTNQTRVFQGDGAGNFTVSAVLTYGNRLIAADMNSDGKMDIAYLEHNVVGVLAGTGTAFNAIAGSPFSLTAPKAIAVADVNGDGLKDILVTSNVSQGLHVLLGYNANLVITWPSPAAIPYGTALSATQLNAVGSQPGTFVYAPAAGTVLNAGTHTLTATLTPTNLTAFSVTSKTVSITVNKVTPSVTWASPAGITYGTALSATELNATASVPGTFVYSPAAGQVLGIGAGQTLSVTFTPTDTTNYNSATATTTITVARKPLTVTGVTAPARNYNGTLTSTVSMAGAALAGVVGGDNVTLSGTATGSFPDANVGTGKTVTITGLTLAGTAAGNYALTAPTVSADITQAPASVTPNSATKVFGQADPAFSGTLTGFIAGDGVTATYSRPAGESVGGSPYVISAVLSPTGALGNYNITYNTAAFTITPVVSVINWATPAAITYGTALSATQLNATEQSSIPGTFSYSPGAGTVPGAGTQTLTVTFTPNDAVTYSTVSASVSLVVNPATPTVTWANPAGITYGTALSATQLNATASVPGTFVYSPAAGLVLSTGAGQTLSVTFTPTDSTNYNSATATTTITVSKAAPASAAVTTTPNPSIYRGNVTFSVTVAAAGAGATPTGTVTFYNGGVGGTNLGTRTLASGAASLTTAALPGGTHSISAVYAGDSNYNGLTSAAVLQTVTPVNPPQVLVTSPASLSYGASLTAFVTAVPMGTDPSGSVVFSVNGSPLGTADLVAGIAVFTSPGLNADAQPYTITATYRTTNIAGTITDTNYVDGVTSASVAVTVTKAATTTSLTPPASPSVYGEVLRVTPTVTSTPPSPAGGQIEIREGATVLATGYPYSEIAWNPSLLTPGTHTITAFYTGDANHLSSSFSFVQTVVKVTPTMSVNLSAVSDLAGDPVVIMASVNAGNVDVTGTVTFTDGATVLGTNTAQGSSGANASLSLPGGLTAGNHTIIATYSGSGNVNPASASTSISLQGVSAKPASLNNSFYGTAGGAASTIPVVVNTTSFAQLSATGNATWLSVSPASGLTQNSTLSITANPAGLAAGVYSATVELRSPSGAAVTTIPVRFTVSKPASAFAASVGSPFAAGAGSFGITTADYNGDGNQDFIVANENANNVSVYLGNGTGGFSAGSTVSVGSAPNGVVAGDFNNDGKQDFAVTNYGASTVSILLGNGAGSFSAGPTVTLDGVTPRPRGITAADFNRDGKLDLAVASEGACRLDVLFGNGSGGFPTTTTKAVPCGPWWVGTGDFNGDGTPDLATVGNTGSATVLLSNGAGGFNQAAQFAVEDTPQNAVVGDINVDGKLDLIVSNQGSNSVSVYLGNGNGFFSVNIGSTVLAGSAPLGMALGDLNGDGKPDVAVVNQGTNNVSVLLGNGTGTLSPQSGSPYSLPTYPRAIALADFNNDGRMDLAVTNYTAASVSVLLGSVATTTGLTASNPADMNQPVTLTATVSSSSGTPAGTVTFWDGAASLGTATLNGAGVATLTTTFSSGRNHSLTASYAGNTVYTPSNGALNLVLRASAPMGIASSQQSSVYGQSVTFNVAVSPVLGATTGTITFRDGATILVSVGISTGGTATFTTTGLAAGSRVISADYSGDTTYTPRSVSLTQTVATKTLTVTGVTAPARAYNGLLTSTVSTAGAALAGVVGTDNVTLSGTAAGSFADANVGLAKTVTITGLTLAGTAAGNYTLTLPTASADITQAPASVTPNSATKVFGQADPAFSGTLTGFIGGDGVTATYSRTAGESVGGSPYAISAVLSPTGALGNYNITYNTAPFTITQVTPAINWATPAAITYGTALSTIQLNATEQSSIPGTFSYNPAAGIVPGAGTQTLTVTFTPTDTATYASVSSSVSLTVNKATPTVTWVAPTAINDGTALSATQLNATASVPGTFAYSPAAGTVLPVGLNQALAVTFTPTDAANYSTAAASNAITVNALLTFNTSPSGLQVVVNGQSYTAPYTAGFAPGAAVTVSAATQTIVANNSQWAFTSWSDAGLAAHSITAGASATYTASFVKQWQFTAAASPAAGGTITPASGWYNDGTVINVSAAANANYSFQSFSGGTLSGATNPQSFTLNAAANVVANFSVLAPNLTIPSQVHTNISASQVQVTFRVRNTGLGAATNVMITGITVALVAGSGTTTADASVTYPISLGTIPAGATVDVPVLLFNWPSTATRDRFTLNLSADGPYSFVPNITVIR